MRISELQLNGFKSFAQKTTFKFLSGEITGIVGPNGSGKSNIVDALRWVLGEQRTATLRSDKMENVIFNGGAKKKAQGMAEVSLKIENDKGVLPSDYRELVVTRRLFRSGESQYMLNGTKCRLKDINSLFMDTGIGPDAYSVIELKMIESILSQNRDERRQLFEEAAGVTKYKRSRLSALRKLDGTRDDLTRLNDIIVEVEKNVRGLSRQVSRVKRFKELQSQFQNLDIRRAQWQFFRLLEGIKPLKEDLGNLQKSNTATSTQFSLDEELLSKYQIDVINFEEKLKSDRETLRKTEEKINELERLQIVEDERVLSNQRNVETYRQEVLEIQEKIKEITLRKDEAQTRLDEFEQEITSHQNSYNEAYGEIQKIEAAMVANQQKVAAKKETLKEVQKDINEISDKKNKLDIQLENFENQLSSGRETLEKIDLDKKSKSGALNEKKSHDDRLNINREALHKERTKLVAEKEKLEGLLEKSHLDLLDLRGKLKDSENQYQFFNDLTRNFTGFSEIVKNVMQEKEKFPGLIGPLAALIVVPDDLSIAFESAVGDWANILVVKDEKTEKDIKEFNSDSKNLFLLNLERLKNYSSFTFPRIAVPSGASGYLIDSIEIREEIRPLIERFFANVMVTDNIEDAVKLWKKFPDHSFYSKNGEVIFAGGVLQSGKRESAFLSGREHLLEKYKKAIKTLTSQNTKAESGLEKIKNDLNQNKTVLNTNTGESENLDRDILSNRSEIIAIETQLRETDNREERILKSIEELQEKINVHKKELKNLNPTIEKLFYKEEEIQTEVEGIQAELEEMQARYSTQSEKANEIRLQLVQTQSNLDQYKNLVKNSDNLKTEYLGTLHRRESDLSSLEKEIKQFGQNKIDREEILINLWQQRDSQSAGIRSDENGLEAIREKTRKTEDQLRQYRQAHELYMEKRQSLEMKIHDAEIRAAAIADSIREKYDVDISEKTPMGEMELEQVEMEMEQVSKRIEAIGEVNSLAIEEYEEENERLEFLLKQRADLLNAEAKLLDTIREINETATKQFLEVFEMIKSNFSRVFNQFFEDGDGTILLEENVDPLEANIEISVRPKGRKPQTISLMSSGEKSLTAISLLFSIYLVKPSPFCIMDEVDAPLDDVNVGRFNRAIARFNDDTQFIIVTHNKKTMEVLDSVYGITQEEPGVSKVVSVDFKKMGLN